LTYNSIFAHTPYALWDSSGELLWWKVQIQISVSQIKGVAYMGTGFDESGTGTAKNPRITSIILTGFIQMFQKKIKDFSWTSVAFFKDF